MAIFRVVVVCSVLCCFSYVYCKIPLYVGTLLPSTPNEQAYSHLTVPSVELAVDHINESPDILPEYQIILRLRDSGCDVGKAGYQMYGLISEDSETKVAMIGEECSIVTQPLGLILKYWNIPQFNFLSTSPALDDREKYPNYYHVLPSENGLNPSRAAVMKSLDWSHSILLVEPSDLFDLNAKDLRNEMSEIGLKRPEILLLSDDDYFGDTIKHIKDTDIHILFGLFYEEKGRHTICELYKHDIHAPNYVWVFVGWYHSIDWYLHDKFKPTNCTDEEMKEAVNGHFTVDFAQVREDHDVSLPTGKTVQQIAEEFQERVNITRGTSVNDTFRKYSAYGYDMTVALGLVFDNLTKLLKSRGELDILHNFTYKDAALVNLINETLTNQRFTFQGLTGQVEFHNLVVNGPQHKHAGGRIETYYNRNVNDSTLVFQYAHENNDLTRVGEIYWTTEDGSQPVDVRPHEVKHANNGLFITMTILSSIGIIVALNLLMFNWKQRNHWALKKSIPRLNELVLIGALLVYVSVILYGLDGQFFEFNNSSLVCCFLRTIFLAVGFTISFGAVLVRATSDVIEHYVKMTYSSLLVILGTLLFGLLLLIDAIILIVWFAVDPWEKVEEILEQKGTVIFVREKCQSSEFWGYSLIVYKFIVFILCLVITIIQVLVQKSRTTAFPSYADVLACGTGLTLGFAAFGFLFVSDPELQYGFVSMCLILLVSVVLVLLFSKKVYVVWKGIPEPVVKQRQSAFELTEMDRGELKELRTKSSDLKLLVEKLLLERPLSVDGSMAEEVRRVFGYIPGETRVHVVVNPLSSCGKEPRQTSD